MGNDNASRWQPELSDEALAYKARLRSEIEPRLALMKQMRMAWNSTQAEVAEILGTTQSNVSKMEVRDNPPLATLARLAAANGRKLVLAVETDDGTVEQRFEIAGE